MTTKQIVEQILEVFPQYTETLVKLDVNRVYKDFCYKTRILKKQGDLEVVVNTVEYTLPTDFQELVWVKLTSFHLFTLSSAILPGCMLTYATNLISPSGHQRVVPLKW